MHGNHSVTSGEGQARALESWAARWDGKWFLREVGAVVRSRERQSS